MLVSGFLAENFGRIGIAGVTIVMVIICAIGTAFRVRYNITKGRSVAVAATAD
jgi:hypothetical protein